MVVSVVALKEGRAACEAEGEGGRDTGLGTQHSHLQSQNERFGLQQLHQLRLNLSQITGGLLLGPNNPKSVLEGLILGQHQG